MKRIFMIMAVMLMLLSGCNRATSLYGDEIPVTVHTNPFVDAVLNANLGNVKGYINKDNGLLTFTFNYDFDTKRWPPGAKAQGWPAFDAPIGSLIIKVLDKNGQVIAQFVTQEHYIVSKTFRATDEQTKIQHLVALHKINNVIQYQINQRDAAYAARVQFGFSGNL